MNPSSSGASSPLVSVIVPTLNRPRQLLEAIESIEAQSFRQFEILVVSDGGPDLTAELRSRIDAGHLRYFPLPETQGVAAARNKALREARGTYIAYLDDDDIFHPEHLEILVGALHDSTHAVAYSDAHRAEQVFRGDSYEIKERNVAYSDPFNPDRLLITNYIPILCILHRRDCLEKVGTFDESLTSHEDWELWLRMSRAYSFVHVEKVTCEFRWRVNSDQGLSSREEGMIESLRQIYRKHPVDPATQQAIWVRRKEYLDGRTAAYLTAHPRLLASIVICVYNKWEYTSKCLNSILQNVTPGLYEIIVIDNGSSDQTPALANQKIDILRYIRNTENVGFTLACNQGAAIARGEYLILLNNDTQVAKGWLEFLIAAAQNDPTVGAVGSKLVFPNGKLQEAGVLVFQDGDPWLFGRDQDPANPLYNIPTEVDYCSGASLLVRKDLFDRLGGFDKAYAPAYCEDVDLCFGLRKLGYKVVYEPRSWLIHYENVTSRETGAIRNFDRNRKIFRDKWAAELAQQDPPPRISGQAPTTASRLRLVEAAKRAKRKIKLTNDYAAGEVNVTVGTGSDFAQELKKIITERRFTKIIETGTYHGTGTTLAIALALRELAIPARFFTLECNPVHYGISIRNLDRKGLLGAVTPLHGLSVPRHLLPTLEQVQKWCVEDVEFDDIYIDHQEAERARLYFLETHFNEVTDDLLGVCLRSFDNKPDFVLLDSGGHMGNVEFNYLIEALEAPCVIALDDIHHIKHHRSYRQIKSDPRFKLRVESREKFGFCIAEFTPQPFRPKHILWLRTDAVGDNIWAAGMLPHIRGHYPGARLTVLCNHHLEDLYRVNPNVDGVLPINKEKAFSEPGYFEAFCEFLRQQDFDLVLGSVFSREPLIDILARSTRARRVIGHDCHLNNISAEHKEFGDLYYTKLVPQRAPFEHESERNLDFLRALGIEAGRCDPAIHFTAEDEAHANRLFQAHHLDPARTVVLVVGVGRSHRLYLDYGRAIGPVCRELGLRVVLVGTPADRPLIDQNRLALGDIAIDLAGQTTIRQLAAFVKKCRIVVGAETGTTNLASALKVPTVTLMGGGDFGRFLPYGPHDAIACLPLACYNCGWHCRFASHHCVRDIAPEVLREAFRRTLEGLGDKPRIFVQARDRFVSPPGGPEWEMPTRCLRPGAVDFITVSPPLVRWDSAQEAAWLGNVPADIKKIYDVHDKLLQDGHVAKARQILLKGISLNPNQPTLPYLHARRLVAENQGEEAISFLRERITPQSAAPLRYLLAELLAEAGRPAEALAVAEEILGANPQDPLAAALSHCCKQAAPA